MKSNLQSINFRREFINSAIKVRKIILKFTSFRENDDNSIDKQSRIRNKNGMKTILEES